MGVPMIGCSCEVCQSPSPYDKRLRVSALVTVDKTRLLIDCGPDFREQALRYGIDRLDGALITHAHHDHTASVDELRVYPIYTKEPIPCLVSRETAEELNERFGYIFKPKDPLRPFIPKISLQFLKEERGVEEFLGVKIGIVTYHQMGMKVNGFRFGNLAYISDIHDYPDSIFEDLVGIETLIISALRPTPSIFHFSVDQAIAFAQKVGAKTTWLTHISHELKHESVERSLPSNVHLAYDGLEISFTPE